VEFHLPKISPGAAAEKLFIQESPASNDPKNRDENAKPESFDRACLETTNNPLRNLCVFA
jgi:hypothetical protein